MRRGLTILGAIPLLLACAGGSATTSDAVQTTAPTVSAEETPTTEPSDEPTVSAPPVVAFDDIVLKGRGKKVAKFDIPRTRAR